MIGSSADVRTNHKCSGTYTFVKFKASAVCFTNPLTTGRYVGIKTTKSQALQLCEVEIYLRGNPSLIINVNKIHIIHYCYYYCFIALVGGMLGKYWLSSINLPKMITTSTTCNYSFEKENCCNWFWAVHFSSLNCKIWIAKFSQDSIESVLDMTHKACREKFWL